MALVVVVGLLNSPSLYLLSHTQSPSTTRRIPCYPPFLHVPSSFYFSFLTLFPSPLPLSFKLFFLLLYYPTIHSLTSFYTIPLLFFLPTVSSLFSLLIVLSPFPHCQSCTPFPSNSHMYVYPPCHFLQSFNPFSLPSVLYLFPFPLGLLLSHLTCC